MHLSFLVVDDEQHICKLIAKFLTDHFTPCHVDFAHNGNDAFRCIQEMVPDIVITDIRIPEPDGIQLVEKAWNAHCKSKFIIVSGYKKFEYAHSALKFGVEDYLLKPIDEKELVATVENIIEKFRRNQSTTEKYNQIQSQNHEYAQKLKVNALTALLQGTPDDRSLLRYTAPQFLTVVTQFCIGADLAGNQTFFSMVEKSISGILRAFLFSRCASADLFVYRGVLVAQLNCDPEAAIRIDEGIRGAGKAVDRWAAQHSSLNISIGVSRRYTDILQFPNGFQEALSSAHAHVACGFRKVFWADDFAGQSLTLPLVIQQELRRFPRLMEDYQPVATRQYISGLVRTVQQTPTLHPAMLYEIREQLLAAIDAYRASLNTADQPEQPPETFLSVAGSYSAFLEELTDTVCTRLEAMTAQKQAIESIPVVRVKQYIQKHLAREITLEQMAEEVHLSPTYLSALFKKTTGTNFLDYVIVQRMKEAQRLLIHSEMNISEIAATVGYSDIRAFSKRFKKENGITPTEFRSFHFDCDMDWWE